MKSFSSQFLLLQSALKILFLLFLINEKVFSAILDTGSFSCGIQVDNTIICWGNDFTPPSGTFFQVSTENYACGIRTNNTLECWGNEKRKVTMPPEGTFSQVSTGSDYACGIQTNNMVVCWGDDNEYGQATPPNTTFIQISASKTFTCGIQAVDNTLACWGAVYKGPGINVPIENVLEGAFSQISAAHKHICGIRVNDTLACSVDGINKEWDGEFFKLEGKIVTSVKALGGDGKAVPPGNGTFSQVSAGSPWYTCWLRTDHAVLCSGTLEFPHTEGLRPPHSHCDCQLRPACLCEAPSDFIQISAGLNHVCGILPDHTVRCWGENGDGKIIPPAGLVLKSSDPTTCLLYGVHDDGNDTQFFIINSGSSELHPRSQLESHLDIQALDSHPFTNQLYAASGNNTDHPGYLYEVRNGAQDLLKIGESGFKSIEALAFHPDGSLWGWSQHAGVFQIETRKKDEHALDLETLNVILPYDREAIGVEIEITDLTWNTEGTALYGAGKILINDTTFKGRLWTYTPEKNQINSVCEQLVEPLAIEAIERLPNNTLLLSFTENEQLNFWVITEDTCDILTQEEIDTSYHQVKGLAQPDCSHPYVDPLANN